MLALLILLLMQNDLTSAACKIFSIIHIYLLLVVPTNHALFHSSPSDKETKEGDRRMKERKKQICHKIICLHLENPCISIRPNKRMTVQANANCSNGKRLYAKLFYFKQKHFCLSPFEISHELCAISFNTSVIFVSFEAYHSKGFILFRISVSLKTFFFSFFLFALVIMPCIVVQ